MISEGCGEAWRLEVKYKEGKGQLSLGRKLNPAPLRDSVDDHFTHPYCLLPDTFTIQQRW